MAAGIANHQAFGQKSRVKPVGAHPWLSHEFQFGRGHQRAEIARGQNEIGAHDSRLAGFQHGIARCQIIVARPDVNLPAIEIFQRGLNEMRVFAPHFAENSNMSGHARFATSSIANSVTLL